VAHDASAGSSALRPVPNNSRLPSHVGYAAPRGDDDALAEHYRRPGMDLVDGVKARSRDPETMTSDLPK
jgi:hypothetical protein